MHEGPFLAVPWSVIDTFQDPALGTFKVSDKWDKPSDNST